MCQTRVFVNEEHMFGTWLTHGLSVVNKLFAMFYT
jgi:hypothetical protein